jgi:hypothetical protein
MSPGEYRRALVRAKDDAAADEIRADVWPGDDRVEIYRISDEVYEKYFQLFNDLERLCGVGGDDFTTEEIEADRLENVSKTAKTYPRRDTHGKLDVTLDELLDRLWGMCERTRTKGGGVFLIL